MFIIHVYVDFTFSTLGVIYQGPGVNAENNSFFICIVSNNCEQGSGQWNNVTYVTCFIWLRSGWHYLRHHAETDTMNRKCMPWAITLTARQSLRILHIWDLRYILTFLVQAWQSDGKYISSTFCKMKEKTSKAFVLVYCNDIRISSFRDAKSFEDRIQVDLLVADPQVSCGDFARVAG